MFSRKNKWIIQLYRINSHVAHLDRPGPVQWWHDISGGGLPRLNLTAKAEISPDGIKSDVPMTKARLQVWHGLWFYLETDLRDTDLYGSVILLRLSTRYMKGTRQKLSRAANVSTTPCHLTNDEVIFHHLLLYSWSSIHSDNRIFRLYTLGVLFSISLVLHCRKASKNKENPVFRHIAWLALCT